MRKERSGANLVVGKVEVGVSQVKSSEGELLIQETPGRETTRNRPAKSQEQNRTRLQFSPVDTEHFFLFCLFSFSDQVQGSKMPCIALHRAAVSSQRVDSPSIFSPKTTHT